MIDIQQIERLARAATPSQLMAQAKFRCAADESAVLEMVELIRELAGALDSLLTTEHLPHPHFDRAKALIDAGSAAEKARRAGVEVL